MPLHPLSLNLAQRTVKAAPPAFRSVMLVMSLLEHEKSLFYPLASFYLGLVVYITQKILILQLQMYDSTRLITSEIPFVLFNVRH